MNDSLPKIGEEILNVLQVVNEGDNVTTKNLEKLAHYVVKNLISYDPRKSKHTAFNNGGVCGYNHMFRWHKDEPIASNNYIVLVYGIVIRDTKNLDPPNGRLFEVRPIVGQRRHPWHPAAGGTFQQLCPGDYILLYIRYTYGVTEDFPEACIYSVAAMFRYDDGEDVTQLTLTTNNEAAFKEFIAQIDPKHADHTDAEFLQKAVENVIEIPHNPLVAPTDKRRDRQETDRLILKFKEILTPAVYAANQGKDKYVVRLIDKEVEYTIPELIDMLLNNFARCARNTAHKYWAGAITAASANAKVFPIKNLKLNVHCTDINLNITIGKRLLTIVMVTTKHPDVLAGYTVIEKEEENCSE